MSLETSILEHEDYREHPYKDSKGLWSGAIGRCFETNPLTGGEWKYLLDNGHLALSITEAGATWLMEQQIIAIRGQCMRMFDFWPDLNDVRRDVIVELCYQMNITGVLRFSKMLEAIRANNFKQAALEGLNSKWATVDSPARARELMKRLETGI